MTRDEVDSIVSLGVVHNKFMSLGEHHPSDPQEWTHHIHALQNMVMARTAMRDNPELFWSSI